MAILNKFRDANLGVKLLALLVTAMLAIIIATSISHAADKAGAAPKQQPADDSLPFLKAPTSWTGCYIGPSLKKTVGMADFGSASLGVDGYAMGFMGGCDVKVGVLVVGGFADYDWDHVSQFGGQSAREWSFGGRAGFVPHAIADNTLLYGLVSRPQLQVNATTVNGLGVGGGIETQITKWVSVALEYRHNTFDDLLPGRNAREDTVGLRGALRLDVPAFNR